MLVYQSVGCFCLPREIKLFLKKGGTKKTQLIPEPNSEWILRPCIKAAKTRVPPRFLPVSQGNPNTQGELHIGDVVLRARVQVPRTWNGRMKVTGSEMGGALPSLPNKNFNSLTSWWFQPLWKMCSSKWGSSSLKIGVRIKNIWNHHPDKGFMVCFLIQGDHWFSEKSAAGNIHLSHLNHVTLQTAIQIQFDCDIFQDQIQHEKLVV